MNSVIKIQPISFISAITNALELSSKGISSHHLRTAMISFNFAKVLNLSQDDLEVLIYASLLHDIGAASNWNEKIGLLRSEGSEEIYDHAIDGCRFLSKSKKLAYLAEPIHHHHDHYTGGNPCGLKGEAIPLVSRIIRIADRIEVLIKDDVHIFEQKEDIIQAIESCDTFDPNLVKVFRELSQTDYFWLDIINTQYKQYVYNNFMSFGRLLFDVDDMISIAEIFSQIIDATSHYTAKHSLNVAKMAKYLALKRGFCEEESKLFYLAGLLHDLGKLAVPNRILDKPGKLTKSEFDLVKQHPYYSRRILEQIDGFEEIAKWAGNHHETLNGQGYPFRETPDRLDLGCRIIAVADVFTALVEDRPYRDRLTIDEVFGILNQMVSDLKLDPILIDELKRNKSELEEEFYERKKIKKGRMLPGKTKVVTPVCG